MRRRVRNAGGEKSLSVEIKRFRSLWPSRRIQRRHTRVCVYTRPKNTENFTETPRPVRSLNFCAVLMLSNTAVTEDRSSRGAPVRRTRNFTVFPNDRVGRSASKTLSISAVYTAEAYLFLRRGRPRLEYLPAPKT